MKIGSKTKIIATLGPATNDKQILRKMIEAGLDVFRLNFSHGSYEDKALIIRTIRELESKIAISMHISDSSSRIVLIIRALSS